MRIPQRNDAFSLAEPQWGNSLRLVGVGSGWSPIPDYTWI